MSNNELTVKNEKTLSQRLGLTSQTDYIAEDIFVSKYGTVDLGKAKNNVFDLDEETTFTHFIKTIDKRINNNGDLVKYDKETNSFYIVSKKTVQNQDSDQEIKVAHRIAIDEEAMKDYANGKFDKYTSILHNLCIESEQNRKIKEKEEAREKEKNAIITKANNSHNELTPLEARTYLDHLEKKDKNNIKDIAVDSGKLAVVTGVPLGAGIACAALGIGLGVPGVNIAIATVLGTTMGGITEGMVNMFRGESYGLEIFPISKTKELVNRIRAKFSELKVNKTKERELKKVKYVDKIVMPNSVTIEEKDPVEPLELKDNIMNEIDSMVDRIAYLNTDDRSILLSDIKNLLNDYIERKTTIIGQDNKVSSQAERDNLIRLRNDMCKKLAKIEIRVNDVKAKDTKKKAVTEEGKLLTEKIEKVDKLEPQQQEELNEMLQDVQEEQKEEKAKVSAK